MGTSYFILQLFLLPYILAQDNILQNPGFEDPLDGSDWKCGGCTLTQDPDAYSGSFSGKVTDRQEHWSNVNQVVPLEKNTHYYFTAYIKLAEMNEGAMWHVVDILLTQELENGETEYKLFGTTPYLKLEQGWEKIGGDFTTDGRNITKYQIKPQVNENGENTVAYYIDEASLVAVPDNPNWKEEANDRINQLRKNDVTINLSVSGEYDPFDLEVKVNQISNAFPFGSAIVDGQIAGDTDYNRRYQDTFYTHFNWAVMENALKWKIMEKNRGEIEYPDKSILRLSENGVPVRGHCVFWAVEKNVPEWLLNMSSSEVLIEMQRRVEYVVTRYDDYLIHWDVNNEQEHGAWFESKTGNPYIMNDMFTEVRSRDNDVVLFLNDYSVVSSGISTQSYANKAMEVNAATGEVGGVGVQSHINGYPNVDAIQLRLDVLASAGFPIWVTELDISIEDVDQRANAYDDLVTLYYSHPDVHGVLLWGFSDNHHWKENCALFEGDNFVPNAAGERWRNMMFNRWRSNHIFVPTEPEEMFGFRGFHGSYNLRVLNDSVQISSQKFDLQPGQDIIVDVQI